ncbi:MAG TPA: hypothetical protein VGI70_03475, partial [Polyangiales bacterium]
TWYHGVRFILRKDGPGYVAFAELRAQDGQDSCTAPPLKLANRPDGAICESDDECSSGKCWSGSCGECASDRDCAAGQVCGEAAADAGPASRCTDLGSSEFGHLCSGDAECTSNVCNAGVCSECSASAPCDGGASCARAQDMPPPTHSLHWPTECAPDRFSRKPGELCVDDEDCISRACSGASKACVGMDCRLEDDDAGLCAALCNAWAITGGSCQ